MRFGKWMERFWFGDYHDYDYHDYDYHDYYDKYPRDTKRSIDILELQYGKIRRSHKPLYPLGNVKVREGRPFYVVADEFLEVAIDIYKFKTTAKFTGPKIPLALLDVAPFVGENERFAIVIWEDNNYKLITPTYNSTDASVEYDPNTIVPDGAIRILDIHTHPFSVKASFSGIDDSDDAMHGFGMSMVCGTAQIGLDSKPIDLLKTASIRAFAGDRFCSLNIQDVFELDENQIQELLQSNINIYNYM